MNMVIHNARRQRSINFDILIDEKHHLVTENGGLIGSCLARYPSHWSFMSYQEAHDLCEYAMAKAAKTFNESRGYRFSTLAYRCMLNKLKRENERAMKRSRSIKCTLIIDSDHDVEDRRRVVRESEVAEELKAVRRIIRRKREQGQSDKSIARDLGLSVDYVRGERR